MVHDCALIELAPQPALVIRTRTSIEDLPRVLREGFGSIVVYLGELGEEPMEPAFTVYYNMDLQDLDIEFGFSVPKQIAGKGPIQMGQMPSGRAATLLYVGPYSGCKPAHKILMQWVKDQGHETTGVAFEKYLNNPYDTPEEALQAQIGILLKD